MRDIMKRGLSKQDFAKAEKALVAAEAKYMAQVIDDFVPYPVAKLPPVQEWYLEKTSPATKTQGINPMAYNNSPTTATTAVSINATTQKSDLQIQREYVLSRLDDMKGRWDVFPEALREKMRKHFRLFSDGQPSKPQDLIDAIKGGKFTLDEKRIKRLEAQAEFGDDFGEEDYDPFSGYDLLGFFTFTDFPKPDRVGFNEAEQAYLADWQKVKDQIMTGDPTEAMKAVQALSDWTPPAKAS